MKKSESVERQPIHAVLFRPQKLVLELGLLALLLIIGFFSIALWSYNPGDPGFTSTGAGASVHNAAGLVGAWIADISRFVLGYGAYGLPALIVILVVRQFLRMRAGQAVIGWHLVVQLGGLLLMTLSLSVLASMHGVPPGHPPGIGAGGVVGDTLANGLIHYLGALGSTLVVLIFVMLAVTAITGLSWLALFDLTGQTVLGAIWAVRHFGTAMTRLGALLRQIMPKRRRGDDRPPIPVVGESGMNRKDARKAIAEPVIDAPKPAKPAARIEKPVPEPAKKPAPKPQRKPVQPALGTQDGKPIVELLDQPVHTDSGYSRESLDAMSRLIEERLGEFGVQVQVVAAHPGPVITRFEIEPAPGVKVSQISNLSKDLARALSIISVRVVEVIPGKSTVGLEIPNQNREIIALRELLESRRYRESRSPLTMALGKDIAGGPVMADLARMPHLLVAGTTGSGKSVGVNAMILSLLYKARSDEVRLILIDPKMLELSVYEGIPHLLAPVVTDMNEAANALRWAVGEMERRYKLMAALGVRNIAGANDKIRAAAEKGEPIRDPLYNHAEALDPDLPPPELETMPYLVVVVDEFADMMMVVGKKVEELIARLAQKARAAGIHLILATQRPSVDVITGLIKANIPTRIAFQVSSKIDSRTILDQMGAKHLLGHGDMLYLPPGTGMPVRVHGAFVADEEVHRVVEALKALGEPNYVDEVLSDETANMVTLPGEKPAGGSGGDVDELYDQAVAIVTETRKASISYVQRRLKIGYNRAARLVESMEEDGVVGALQPNGSREVIAPPPPR